MKIIGIVVEYNPFHNGHLYQIKEIKKIFKDSLIIVCMSSSFTQRGELSILNKYDKTKVAIENGVDIVVELPYVYSVQSSDIFAKYSVSLLNTLHIDTLVFGTETKDITNIIEVANAQTLNKEYDLHVKKHLDKGISYPAALSNALKDIGSYSIESPNDLLALSYIKEIYNSKYNIDIYNIKRTNDFHDKLSNDKIVSATNIREKINNNKDFSKQVPKNVYNILKNKKFDNKYFDYLKYKIYSEDDLNKYLDVDEGLSVRIKKYIDKSNSTDELIKNIKTKRYTYNRISRMLNHILCSFTKEENNRVKNIEYIRILGFNESGKNYLNSIKKTIVIPVLNKYDTKKYKTLEIEKRVTDIYSHLYENIIEKEIKNIPIKIKEE
ncbi:MAG: nucleotidyltransferase [Tenericutes bacterium]|nr:nucleotidyltransferase [Mycoplasmatota bacterium]